MQANTNSKLKSPTPSNDPMDEFYNTIGAAEALEKSAVENEEVSDRRLASLMKDVHTKYKVKRFDHPTTFRLVETFANDRIAEEAVFTLKGILTNKNLPPVTEKINTASQARYLRQGISLVGYRTTTFEKAITNAQEIYGKFERNIPDASLEPWTLSVHGGGRVIEASNRYFTSKRDAPDVEPVPISPFVDPRGILEKLSKDGYIYGEENEVLYYEVHNTDIESDKRVETVNPQIFRVGDIVEAQVSFIVVPLKDHKHKMIVILRSIALLDTTFSQQALKRRTREVGPRQMTLKRRVGYGDYIAADGTEQMQVDKRAKDA